MHYEIAYITCMHCDTQHQLQWPQGSNRDMVKQVKETNCCSGKEFIYEGESTKWKRTVNPKYA